MGGGLLTVATDTAFGGDGTSGDPLTLGCCRCGISLIISLAKGGTGATDAAGARTAFAMQAWNQLGVLQSYAISVTWQLNVTAETGSGFAADDHVHCHLAVLTPRERERIRHRRLSRITAWDTGSPPTSYAKQPCCSCLGRTATPATIPTLRHLLQTGS